MHVENAAIAEAAFLQLLHAHIVTITHINTTLGATC